MSSNNHCRRRFIQFLCHNCIRFSICRYCFAYIARDPIVVEAISGDPLKLKNQTLFQDEFDNYDIPRAYASITDVEKLIRDGREFYKLSVDFDYQKDITFDGSVLGDFSVHPFSRIITKVSAGSSVIDVDSTVGFPKSGELVTKYTDGATGIITATGAEIGFGTFTALSAFFIDATSGIITTTNLEVLANAEITGLTSTGSLEVENNAIIGGATSTGDFRASGDAFIDGTLTVAGDINVDQTKKWIEEYFGPIPKGSNIQRNFPREFPITKTIRAEAFDPNIQIPAIFLAYRTPGRNSRDSRVLDVISTYLSQGKSSKLYKKLVDDQKMSLEVTAFNMNDEDYSTYVILSLPLGETKLENLITEIDEELTKIQKELISEKDYQKLQNQFESEFVNSNSTMEGIANSLAEYYVFYNGDTNLINKELDIYKSITKEEIRNVAQKYLNPNQRLELHYLPKVQKEEK